MFYGNRVRYYIALTQPLCYRISVNLAFSGSSLVISFLVTAAVAQVTVVQDLLRWVGTA